MKPLIDESPEDQKARDEAARKKRRDEALKFKRSAKERAGARD